MGMIFIKNCNLVYCQFRSYSHTVPTFSVTKRDNTVQYNGKLIPSNQHADVDMRSVDAQKTEPSEIVSASVTVNRDRGQTSAPQSEPITGRDLQTTQNSVVAHVQVNVNEHALCTSHTQSCHGWV